MSQSNADAEAASQLAVDSDAADEIANVSDDISDEEFGAELMAALDAEGSSDEEEGPAGSGENDEGRPAKRQRHQLQEQGASGSRHQQQSDHPGGAHAGAAGSVDRNGAGVFGDLPPEVLFRTLGFLSPEDLMLVAQSSRFMRAVADDNVLWRRLYAARWRSEERPPGHSCDEDASWKSLYLDMDRLEVMQALRGVGGGQGAGPSAAASSSLLARYYVQMATGKRSQCLGRRHSDDTALSPLGSNAAPGAGGAGGEALLRWRRDRGFRNPGGAWPTEHPCGGGRCTFARLPGGLFVCERSGWSHVCDEGCRERVVDHSTDTLVCPISGRCFDRMLAAHEEDGQGGAEHTEEGVEDFSTSGRLGRAYLDGYSCNSADELRRFCGVDLR